MKTQPSIADLLGLVETPDQRTAGRITTDDPARLLSDLQQKLDLLIVRHQAELQAFSRPPRRKSARRL